MKSSLLFEWPASLPFERFFSMDAHPWEWLPQIKQALESFDFQGGMDASLIPEGVHIEGDVSIHPTVRFLGSCTLQGPCYIGADVQVRPGAFVRGNVIVGAGSVLGNSCEYKNCLLMERVETAHFNYVGDSILGNGAHLGAGVICANLRLARDEVVVRVEGKRYATGMRKVGAFLGDAAEVGCNSVLQPGTILGKRAAVVSMPFQGYLPAGKMAISSGKAKIISRPDLG